MQLQSLRRMAYMPTSSPKRRLQRQCQHHSLRRRAPKSPLHLSGPGRRSPSEFIACRHAKRSETKFPFSAAGLKRSPRSYLPPRLRLQQLRPHLSQSLLLLLQNLSNSQSQSRPDGKSQRQPKRLRGTTSPKYSLKLFPIAGISLLRLRKSSPSPSTKSLPLHLCNRPSKKQNPFRYLLRLPFLQA